MADEYIEQGIYINRQRLPVRKHNTKLCNAANVNNSDIMPQDVKVFMMYAPNAVNTIQLLSVKTKSTNVQDVNKNFGPIMWKDVTAGRESIGPN